MTVIVSEMNTDDGCSFFYSPYYVQLEDHPRLTSRHNYFQCHNSSQSIIQLQPVHCLHRSRLKRLRRMTRKAAIQNNPCEHMRVKMFNTHPAEAKIIRKSQNRAVVDLQPLMGGEIFSTMVM